ncbi:MAG: gliding motility-associated C-terminal domain-containing protein, partial [Bacteroidales bacterium]|nr:gliding motility-associated C-terminal domain-containing protein [Bacteroidales bacterium]
VQKEIQVNELPDVTFNDIPNQCEYSDLVDLSSYAGPIGGTFSGSGVTTQNSFFLFNPAAVEAGSTSTITYTYTDGKNCTNSAQKTIQVIARPSVTFNDVPSLCVGGEKHDLLQYVTPTTGTFSGEYVDGTEFNPTTKGSYKVSYTVESDGCSTTVEKTIVVNELPVLALEMNAVACVNTGNVTPQLSPANGTFTIDGEVSTTINTDNLSVGNHTLEYVYTDPTTHCSNSISKPLEIRKIEKPTVTNKTVVIGSTDLTITAQGNGGTFEWTDQNGTKTTGASISHSDASYAGEWEYCVTESDGTCTSEPACMTFSVIWCPAQAPLVTVSGAYVNHNWADVLYTEICESDEVPTFHVTGIEDGATINWYDGSTGGYITTDSPEAYQNNALKGKPGEYSMSVSQTTTGENGCTSIPTSVIVKIHENPHIAITNDDVHFCDYDDKVQIEVSSDSDNGTFTYSGDFVEDNYFYPANATTIGMAISVTVNYVDNETRCEATTSADFFVHHADKLAVVSPITQLESDYETVLTATPDGANKVTWYDACETKTKLKEGTSFSTGLVGEVSEDFGVTQTDPYGCESECATIQVNRIKCPTPAPTVTVETNTICATDEVPTFYVSGETGATFSWYENGTLISDDAEFTPTSIQGTAGSYSWTVTQTTTGTNGCEGVAAPVTLKINPSPEIEVTIDEIICQNEGIKVPVSNLTGTIFTFNGQTITQIDPEVYDPDTYELRYSYNDPQTGCRAVDAVSGCFEEDCMKKDIEIRNIPMVKVKNITKLISADEFKVQIESGNGGAYTWIDEHNSLIGIGASIDHQYAKEVGSWTYCVTETDGECTSDPACLTFSIINCPVPSPQVVKDVVVGCTNEDVPEMEVVQGEYDIRWYKQDDLSTIVSTNAKYAPNDITAVGDYTYYVTQFDGECEGVPSAVTLQMKTSSQPKITGNMAICENENLQLTSDVETYWYSDEQMTTADEISKTHTVSYPNAGSYSVYVVHKTEYCSSNPFAVPVQVNAIPEAPVITTENACKGEDIVFTAEGTDIQWYKNSIAIGELGDLTYTETGSMPGNVVVSATQTILGCTSEKRDATAIVYAIPTKPTPLNATICEYDAMTELEVITHGDADATWYSDETLSNVVATGTSYKPRDKVSQSFYVTQTLNGCEGEPTVVTLKVVEKPLPVSFKQVNDIEVCEGNTTVIVAESGNTVYWYESKDDNPVFMGRYFTVPTTAVGDYTYYAKQSDKSGCESDWSEKRVKIVGGPEEAVLEQQDTVCEYEKGGTLIVSRKSENEHVSWVAPNGATLGIGDTLHIADTLFKKAGVYMIKARTTVSTCSFDTRKEINVPYVVHPKPVDPTLLKDAFCYDGQPVTLETAASEPKWFNANGEMIGAYSPQLSTMYSDAGDYAIRMSQTIKGCSSDTVLLPFLISAIPVPQIIGKDQICAGETETYVVTKSDVDNSAIWSVTGNRAIYEISNYSTGFVRSIDWTEEGLDTISVYESNKYGCIGVTVYPVEVVNKPDVQFTAETLGQEGVVTFTNLSEPQILNSKGVEKEYHVDYYWDFGRNTDTAIVLNNFKTFDETYRYGDYAAELTAENEFGCKNSVVEAFFVDVEHGLYFPTAFAPMSPSGDIRVFRPKGFNCTTFKIWIYDQWNNLVYYSEGVNGKGSPNAEWDGKVNGKLMQSGTYRYKVEVTFEDHEEDNFKVTQSVKPIWGNVTLIR